jgi:histidinol-phosphatase (PHP family)
MLPPDFHVHSQWSWDAPLGSMVTTCEQAVRLGLRSIAFTEHVDFTRWVVTSREMLNSLPVCAEPTEVGDIFAPARLDVEGYLECVQACRLAFPELRILTGVELGEAHWFPSEVSAVLSSFEVERVLGSVHSLNMDFPQMVDYLYGQLDPHDLMRAYLSEVFELVRSSAAFSVLAHIDYPVRKWPGSIGEFDPGSFEDEFRSVLVALKSSGRALELNTTVPIRTQIVRWWYEVGGEAVTFGSDAHGPSEVARSFADAASMAEACGFRPGQDANDFWYRSRFL